MQGVFGAPGGDGGTGGRTWLTDFGEDREAQQITGP